MEFRKLKANEILIRVNNITEKGVGVVAYTKADICMDILDAAVGNMNWQKHQEGSKCTLSIWDEEKDRWIVREDYGEGNDEKSISTDAFKRTCACFGIGRELKNIPFMWFSAADLAKFDGKKCYDTFICSSVEYTNTGKISSIQVLNTTNQKVKTFKSAFEDELEVKADPITNQAINRMLEMADAKRISRKMICDRFNVSDVRELSMTDYERIVTMIAASSGCEDVA